ncbi:hypothetical protein ACIBL8_41820 [Streptomyces sp. NPDC050523]|uniref:hypothetical protein n=1 Tax=Streptomyces sp. NPDC050523 TaxID=3365622 RepID=UPI0037A9BDD6
MAQGRRLRGAAPHPARQGVTAPSWPAPSTGGVLQYDGGLPGFVARARELAATYGDRFLPPDSLVERAERGEILA